MDGLVLMFFIGFCIAIGYWSQSNGRSFWFGFLWSFLLSPLIGALIVLVAGKKK